MTAPAAKSVFNPQLTALMSDIGNAFQGVASQVRKTTIDTAVTENFPIWGLLIIMAIATVTIVWWIHFKEFLETPHNIARIIRQNLKAADHYHQSNHSRKGMLDLYNSLVSQGYKEENLAFTNFYVSTVNATGIFFHAVNGVVSIDAARLAVMGGARAFVFDLWPDFEPGAEFSPIIQVVEADSLWRRTTLNALPFVNVLQALITEALQTTTNPGHQDPVILYLRFRGNPRASTFHHTAEALQSTILPYRLDSTFANCRGADRLFRVPIDQLASKVIVISNLRGSGKFSEFVNFSTKDGIQLEYEASQLQLISGDAAANAQKKILMNPTFVAPLSENPLAESNDYNVAAAQKLGIQFVAMNFWNNTKSLKTYMEQFGKYSFALKPTPLQYVVTRLDPPQMPPNPGWGDNAQGQAGTIKAPPDIKPPT